MTTNEQVSEVEEWKPVPGYPAYLVSNRGRVKSMKRGGAMLATGGSRYAQVCLTGPGLEARRTNVCHLVTALFIGPRPAGYDVNHKDGDRRNDNVENLEYVTHAQNVRHGRGAKLNANKADQIREMRRSGIPLASIAKVFGVSLSAAHRAATGVAWSSTEVAA